MQKVNFLTVLILCSLQSTLGKSVVVSGERVMPQGVRVSPTAPKNQITHSYEWLRQYNRILI